MSGDAETGQAVTIGLPRNMVDVPFPDDSPLKSVYPEGYGAIDGCEVDVCMLNSIYTEVELKSPDMYPDATVQGSRSITTCSSTWPASSSSSSRSAASP